MNHYDSTQLLWKIQCIATKKSRTKIRAWQEPGTIGLQDHRTTGLWDCWTVIQGSLGAVLSRLRERGLVKHRGKYWTIEDDDRLAGAAAVELAESSVLEEDEFDKEEWLEHAPDDR